MAKRPYRIKIDMWSREAAYLDAPDPEEGLRMILGCYGDAVRRITLVPSDINKEAAEALLNGGK